MFTFGKPDKQGGLVLILVPPVALPNREYLINYGWQLRSADVFTFRKLHVHTVFDLISAHFPISAQYDNV